MIRQSFTLKPIHVFAFFVLAACAVGIGIGVGYAVWGYSREAPATQPINVRYAAKRDLIMDLILGNITVNATPTAMTGRFRGMFYNRLANLTDTYGPRHAGEPVLETVIDNLVAEMRTQGFDSVITEAVNVSKWLRGHEEAWLLEPRQHKLAMLSIGRSVGTNGQTWTAEAVVIRSFDALATVNATGKIVVLNNPWINYENGYDNRVNAAHYGMKYGAKAVLIRTVGSMTINTPHTGSMVAYDPAWGTAIPAACISIEDAEMLDRMQQRGQRLNIALYMEAQSYPDTLSRNIIVDIKGSELPNEIVLISGHLDSWDVGNGAMDDGCGAVLSWQTLLALKELDLRPRRTLRLVMWTSEETGAYGAQQYFNDYSSRKDEKHVFVFESDFGVFKPAGLGVTSWSIRGKQIVAELAQMFDNINATTVLFFGADGTSGDDVDIWEEQGIPGATLLHENYDLMSNYYFAFHHSNGDSMSVLRSDAMDLASALWTVTAYVIADMNETEEIYNTSIHGNRTEANALADNLDDGPVPWVNIIAVQASYSQVDISPLQEFSGTSSIYEEYATDAGRIIDALVRGPLSGNYYDRLATFVDTFGPRMSGTPELEKAIDWAVDNLKLANFSNVHTENASVPYWTRGEESAKLVSPREHDMTILGLGGSVGTGPSGIEAEALVVESFEELIARKDEAKGKIVVYAPPYWVNYGTTGQYRFEGAIYGQAVNAAAVLARSAASFSIYSPHTGIQSYNTSLPPIPAASITVEDADMMRRMQQRGQQVTVFLNMSAQPLGNTMSRNTIAEIVGWDKPNEIVLISGHMDSWDVGQGAMDDGCGFMLAWQTLATLQYLGLKPRRTIRAVFWTGEEQGGYGGDQYYKDHMNETVIFAMESDMGVFKPAGLFVYGNSRATELMLEILQLLKPINASFLSPATSDDIGEDVDDWNDYKAVPGATLLHEDYQKWYNYYFAFHHSNGDTMSVLNSDDMDLAAALWTVVTYVVADMDETIPSGP